MLVKILQAIWLKSNFLKLQKALINQWEKIKKLTEKWDRAWISSSQSKKSQWPINTDKMITFIYNFKNANSNVKKIYFYNIRWAKIQQLVNSCCWQGRKPALLPTAGESNFKWICLCRALWQFLWRLKLDILFDSALSHTGICTIETRKEKMTIQGYSL